ncbi:MAG: TraI domain-containing protein [Pseudomonadales bacterium]|nr:TraI domain-containing protein [Pseudomonadales bacterium]
METQTELITRIKGALRFNPVEFDEIVAPVIERYAAYVHLLPASETHHHRGAGGLFRHGLEVGFWAAQKAEAHQFCLGESPKNRRDNEPRWQFAAFLGGLLHDVGKPLSDVAVTDMGGKTEWNPYASSLADWTQQEHVEHYFLRWRDKRNKRHEKFSMMNLDQIITPKAKSYLNAPGPHIMEALLEALVGTGASEALTQLVMWADQESVRRDLVNQRLDVDEYAYGVPVERFIFDALRRLVGITKVNEPGAFIWRLENGVFLAWNHIVPEIHNLLEKDKIPGVPRNADTLADILIERGFAIPYQESTEAKPVRYWKVFPEVLKGIPQNCLRLDDLELIFTGEPPAPVKAGFNAALPPPQPDVAEQSVHDQQMEGNQQPEKEAELQRPDKVNTVQPSFVPAQAAPTANNNYSQPIPPAEGYGSPPQDMMEAPPSMYPEDYQTAYDVSGNDSMDHMPSSLSLSRKPSKKQALQNNSGKSSSKVARLANLAVKVEQEADLKIPLPGRKPIVDIPVPETSGTSKSKAFALEQQKTISETKEAIVDLDSAGWKLIQQAVRSVGTKSESLERLSDGDYAIPYPVSARLLGEPREVMITLSEEGLLRSEQASTSKTATIGGKKYLVFNDDVSKRINVKLDGFENKQIPDDGANAKTKKKKKDVKQEIKPVKAKKKSTPEKLNTAKKKQENKFAERKKEKSKLPSLDEFSVEFIKQVTQGYGLFIEGDVKSKNQGDKAIYEIPNTSIKKMASHFNISPSVITIFLRKVDGLTIPDKKKIIELVQEA